MPRLPLLALLAHIGLGPTRRVLVARPARPLQERQVRDLLQAGVIGLPSALITLSIALGFDRIGTAGLVLGPLVLAVAAIGFDAATAADEDSDEDEEDGEDVQPTTAPPPVRAMFDAASSVTDSDKSGQCPPDLPPRDGPTATTTENGEKAPPPLPPRGAVAKSPSRASPYAGLGK